MERHEFLDRLYEYCDNGQIQLRAIHITAGIRSTELVTIGDWSQVDRFCRENDRVENYFTVATRNGGGTKEHIREIPVLHCDLDFKDTSEKQAIQNIQGFPFEPSIIVRSGGGFQLYWILKEPAEPGEISQVEDALRRIAGYLGGDLEACDASRILRLPGTRNHKYQDQPVVVITRESNREYILEDILSILPGTNILQKPNHDHMRPQVTTDDHRVNLAEGHRDESLFHIANCLVKGNMGHSDIEYVLEILGKNCNPPFPSNQIKSKIQSALKRISSQEKNITQEVREWVLTTSGHFLTTDVYNGLQVTTRTHKKAITMSLLRLKEQGIIEAYGRRAGCYRRIETDCAPVDWKSAKPEPVAIRWPFRVESYVTLYPGNIAVLAGEQNAGKTALLLNMVALNEEKFKIHYFSSEMGPEEMRVRADCFENADDWRFQFYERSSNFADVIKPDDLNIIDFIEIHENFYEIGGMLQAIHEKLDTGLAIIALQKPPGRDIAKGGYSSLEKPRLYLALSNEFPGHRLKIVKGKNWAQRGVNPNGLNVKFYLSGGSELSRQYEWERPR